MAFSFSVHGNSSKASCLTNVYMYGQFCIGHLNCICTLATICWKILCLFLLFLRETRTWPYMASCSYRSVMAQLRAVHQAISSTWLVGCRNGLPCSPCNRPSRYMYVTVSKFKHLFVLRLTECRTPPFQSVVRELLTDHQVCSELKYQSSRML